MVEVIDILFMRSNKRKNENITLLTHIFNYNLFFKRLKTVSFVLVFLILLLFLTVPQNKIYSFFLIILTILIFTKWSKKIREMKKFVQKDNRYRFAMYDFMLDHHLYTENENRGFEASAMFSIFENKDILIITAHKDGGIFTRKMAQLSDELTAFVGSRLIKKIERAREVEYHFQIVEPERLYLASTGRPECINSCEIDLGYGVIYNPIHTPHILLTGGTGSGKSLFISFIIIELLKIKADITIADIKKSDLSSLSAFLGTDKVASSSTSIAKVVRLAVEEMRSRYDFINAPENFKYGSNFSDHGFNQKWLLFDEIGAFSGSATDKKSKEIVTEVMDGIKQLILLGRQAGVFILIAGQQVNASNVSTELRDNLGLRIALGANSQEGYRMVFGSAMPEILPAIEVKGSGLLYMQGSGKESAEYYEAPYMNPKDFDFIKEIQLYVNNNEEYGRSQELII